MIGFYNYTMLLTYLSLASAGLGILISQIGEGHPFIGMFFLLFCGLCDAFDGKVARMKKDRTELENKYGVQLDSLSDIVAFGVLPTCIGSALIRRSDVYDMAKAGSGVWEIVFTILVFAVMVLYLIAGLIRLAYFNVTEEERQKVETGARKHYLGLPITSAAIVCPFVLLVHYVLLQFLSLDITPVYFAIMALSAILFVTKFQLKKPGMKAILVMIGIGVGEAILMVIAFVLT